VDSGRSPATFEICGIEKIRRRRKLCASNDDASSALPDTATPVFPQRAGRGAFYPEKKTKGFDELKFYSQVFNTCEINNTFYRPPSAKVTKAWATKTPDDFLFSLKVWQKFTHPMKISSRKKSDEKWEPVSKKDFDEFRAGILPLAEAEKLGVLLFQYPISFHYSPENIEAIQKQLTE
jgi:uncharacterized protein YecE (DUF72 family)